MPILYVLSGRDLGKSFRVGHGSVLGRNPACAVALADASVSRRHARLDRTAGGWELIDLGSRNGITAGGERRERWALTDGDEIKLGEVALRFRLADEAPPEAAGPLAAELAPAEASAPPAAGAAYETAGSLEFEDEIQLESLLPAKPALPPAAPLPPAPAPAVRPAPQGLRSEPVARAPVAPTAPAVPEMSRDARAELLAKMRREQSGGFFAGDLSQLPFPLRALLVLLALVVGAALFWGAYQGVVWLRTRS